MQRMGLELRQVHGRKLHLCKHFEAKKDNVIKCILKIFAKKKQVENLIYTKQSVQ